MTTPTQDSRAHAHLIDAAPDLLAAFWLDRVGMPAGGAARSAARSASAWFAAEDVTEEDIAPIDCISPQTTASDLVRLMCALTDADLEVMAR